MPGTTTPLPNGLPRLWVTQTMLPSRSAIENEVVWCSFWPSRRAARPLLGRPDRPAAVAHARPQPLDMVVRQDFRELAGAGLVGDAHAGREPDRAIDRVEMLDAVALQPGEIKALEDAQGQQELESLAGRRRLLTARPR